MSMENNSVEPESHFAMGVPGQRAHLQRRNGYRQGDSKSIFYMTGLYFSPAVFQIARIDFPPLPWSAEIMHGISKTLITAKFL